MNYRKSAPIIYKLTLEQTQKLCECQIDSLIRTENTIFQVGLSYRIIIKLKIVINNKKQTAITTACFPQKNFLTTR